MGPLACPGLQGVLGPPGAALPAPSYTAAWPAPGQPPSLPRDEQLGSRVLLQLSLGLQSVVCSGVHLNSGVCGPHPGTGGRGLCGRGLPLGCLKGLAPPSGTELQGPRVQAGEGSEPCCPQGRAGILAIWTSPSGRLLSPGLALRLFCWPGLLPRVSCGCCLPGAGLSPP